MHQTLLSALVVIVALPAQAAAGVTADDYEARVYTDAAGNTMPYRLFVPRSYTPDQQYPLVIFLHGGGSTGTDNRHQIECCSGARVWAESDFQAVHPAFVLVPQVRTRWVEIRFDRGSHELPEQSLAESLTRSILESVRAEFSIDPRRIYLTGQSLGGYGVWDYATRTPDLFAAIIPVSGGGDPSRAASIASLPVWAFQGELDDTVPVSASRDMVKALLEAGGDPHYTEFPGLAHDGPTLALAFLDPTVREWLFALRKKSCTCK